MRILSGVVACALLAGTAGTARATPADEKILCIRSYEQGQRLRNDGKLREARQVLATCQRDTCPAMVRKDCAEEADRVEDALPTVVLIVRDDRGRDLKDVSVKVDGRLVAPTLDGNAIEVDAGERAFHLEVRGGPVIDQKVLVHAGEKNRPITFALHGDIGGAGGGSEPDASSTSDAHDDGASSSSSSSSSSSKASASSDQLWNTAGHDDGHGVLPWVLVGVGAAAAVAGGVVWYLAQKDVREGQTLCPGGVCRSPADKRKSDDLQHGGETRTYVGVGLVAGGALLAAGGLIWHFVLEKPADPAKPPPASRLTPTISPQGGGFYGGVAYTARFF